MLVRRFLAGVSLLALPAMPALAGEQHADDDRERRQIVVEGHRLPDIFAGLPADSELDENDIAAYGYDTVGELIEGVTSEVDSSGEGPVILINGEPATGLNDVADLPTEAVSAIRVYSGQAAARLGERPTRRVINVTIKKDHRQLTANTKAGLATAGEGFEREGELNLLKLDKGNRRSLVFRARRTDPLFESDRPIVSGAASSPFDVVGNVLPYPTSAGEIDPELSGLAGEVVAVAGVPAGTASPTLTDFATLANRANPGAIGRTRTLVQGRNNYSLNGNLTDRFGPRTTLSVNARADWLEISGLSGLDGQLLRLPASSSFSPFGRDVTVARYLGRPLALAQTIATVTLGSVLNHQVGDWRFSFTSGLVHQVTHTKTDRGYSIDALRAGVLAGSVNPFGDGQVAALGDPLRDRSRTHNNEGTAEIYASGPIATLPAGTVRVAVRAGIDVEDFASRTESALFSSRDAFKRTQSYARGNLTIPLIGSHAIGAISLDLDGAVRHLSAIGTVNEYGGTLSWQPIAALQLRASLEREQVAPRAESLTDPVTVVENFRIYDFVRGETVYVPYLIGGNPALPLQTRRTASFAGTLDLGDLDLTSEYTRIRGHNVMASLPPVSLEVQLAFPDRFQRDASGRLVQVDARPVAFRRDALDQLRTGFSFGKTFGGVVPSADGESGPARLSKGGGWRVKLSATDIWTLRNARQSRIGLPVVDLLKGGAVGYGGGTSRHTIELDANVLHRGVGLEVGANYRGPSRISAGAYGVESPNDLFFASQTFVNSRIFANLGPLVPEAKFLKGTRISLEVQNAFDSKLRVTDRTGRTPLRYQPYLLDPQGRTVKIALRKVF